MKQIFLVSFIFLIISGCANKEADKRAQLEQLKKEHDKLTETILKLEKELTPDNVVSSASVSVETIRKITFEHYIEVQGRIDGNQNIAVNPRNQGGMVTKILVHEGETVTKGQVLAELDAEVLRQQLIDLQNKLAFATDIYNRQKSLWDQQIGSEVQFLKAKNDVETIRNGIATLDEQIKMSVIASPINGTIEEIPIKVGQLTSPASPLPAFRIINFSTAKALADVGEAYSAKVNTGDQVKVFLPDLNQEFTEKVTFASKYINPTNRTFLVEAHLHQPNITFRANMIAVLRILDYTNPAAIAIQQSYIQNSRDDGQFVFVVAEENGKKIARKRSVTPRVSYNGLTEIVNGLSEGDKIITAGYKDLYNGQQIDY
ncbi:MAG: efflux RND transporter periplasmic adaptor subunit [Bacteroidales bacterium]|nr:efflux RND transporter periplasmic adaptor subunit [Bacteroidales bacterium]